MSKLNQRPQHQIDQEQESIQPKQTKQESQPRVFSHAQVIHGDLFKSSVAKMIKDLGMDKSPFRVELEHTHVFRTFDSEGKKHNYCVSVGNHTHEVKWETDPNGVARIIEVGPPVKEAFKIDRRGRRTKVYVPITDESDAEYHDTHTHELTYLYSYNTEIRRTNLQAVTLIATEAQKTAPIPGVQG